MFDTLELEEKFNKILKYFNYSHSSSLWHVVMDHVYNLTVLTCNGLYDKYLVCKLCIFTDIDLHGNSDK